MKHVLPFCTRRLDMDTHVNGCKTKRGEQSFHKEKQIFRETNLVHLYNKIYNTKIIKSPRWPTAYDKFYSIC